MSAILPLILLLVAVANNICTANTIAWERAIGDRHKTRRLQGSENGDDVPVLVKLNHKSLVHALKSSDKGGRGAKEETNANNVTLTFDLVESGTIHCELGSSSVFHPDLAAKYPQLILKSGICSDSRQVSLSVLEAAVDSLGVTFSIPGSKDFVYVDAHEKGSNIYKVRRVGKGKKSSRAQPFTCEGKYPPIRRELEEQEKTLAENESRRRLQTCPNEVAITMADTDFTKDFTSNNANLDTAGTAFSCGSVTSTAPVRNFRFTAPRAAFYKFETCKTGSWSSVMRVSSAACSGTLLVSCNNASPCSSATVQLLAGDVAYVQVATSGGTALPASWRLTASVVQIIGKQYRFAVGVNRELSVYWGSTTANVLNRLAITINRLNGIYMRELGAYFQLVANNDKLLCSDEKMALYGSCALSNTNSITVLNQVMDFIQGRGVSYSDYDLAHVLGTFNGGVAWMNSVCWNGYNFGVSGNQYTDDDGLVVNVMAHEVSTPGARV
jgi:hypothetical protein